MKKTIVIVAACMLSSVAAWSQGTVLFSNISLVSAQNPPELFRVTFAPTGEGVEGPNFVAQLFVDAEGDGAFTAVASPVEFRTGVEAGFFAGGEVAIPGVEGGDPLGAAQVRAWNQAQGSFDVASQRGQSDVFSIPGLGDPTDPTSPTPTMNNFRAFEVVPEPSTIALGVLGAGALLVMGRRRK